MNTPLGTTEAICWLVVFSALFAAAGILYARRHNEDLDAFVTARNTQGPIATLATLLASALGHGFCSPRPNRPPGAGCRR